MSMMTIIGCIVATVLLIVGFALLVWYNKLCGMTTTEAIGDVLLFVLCCMAASFILNLFV